MHDFRFGQLPASGDVVHRQSHYAQESQECLDGAEFHVPGSAGIVSGFLGSRFSSPVQHSGHHTLEMFMRVPPCEKPIISNTSNLRKGFRDTSGPELQRLYRPKQVTTLSTTR